MEIRMNSVSMHASVDYVMWRNGEIEETISFWPAVMNGKLSAESIKVERKKGITIEKSLFESDYKYVDK